MEVEDALNWWHAMEDYVRERLWPILVETVHAMVMYPHHKAYTRDRILHENPNVTPEELAARLSIPLGEALVILFELWNEGKWRPPSQNVDT